MSTTADHPDPPASAAAPTELDASVDALLQEATSQEPRPGNGVGGSEHAGGGGTPRPVPKASTRPLTTDELPQELIGPGGNVIARREPRVIPDSAAAANDAMAGVQADLAPPPRPDPGGAAVDVTPAPATIEALDDALAKKAEVHLEESSAPPPPLVRAVAAHSPPAQPAAPAPRVPAAPPAAPAPILRPDAPMAAARSGAPPIAAATPAAMANAPAPLPVPVESRPGLLTQLLGPLAIRADRLSWGARQTMLWAALVTFISATALWTIVLIRDPNAAPMAPAAAPAASTGGHGDDAQGAKQADAKPGAGHESADSAHGAPAKSGGHR